MRRSTRPPKKKKDHWNHSFWLQQPETMIPHDHANLERRTFTVKYLWGMASINADAGKLLHAYPPPPEGSMPKTSLCNSLVPSTILMVHLRAFWPWQQVNNNVYVITNPKGGPNSYHHVGWSFLEHFPRVTDRDWWRNGQLGKPMAKKCIGHLEMPIGLWTLPQARVFKKIR